jgi:5-methylcytosine-specific restriction endonuclease McrA
MEKKKVYNLAYGDMTYQDYINSHWWKDKREWILHVKGNKCEKCHSTKQLNVHHITYDSLGNENSHDVMILCKRCHKKEHGIK